MELCVSPCGFRCAAVVSPRVAPPGAAAWILGGLSLIHMEILGKIRHVQTIATGRGIRELARLQRLYGRGNWRKRRGEAIVRLPIGAIHEAELHWCEAHDIGKREFKIRRFPRLNAHEHQ